MKYLLGVDFGGGSCKATLIDTCGKIVAEGTKEYPTYYPVPRACEQDPADWIDALCAVTKTILAKSGILPSDILSVAVSSATHTAVLCDKAFKPLRNAVHWTDTRSAEQAKTLESEMGREIFDTMYHKPSPIWTLPQLCYLRETEPEIYQQTAYVFFEKDYIRYFLTGVYCTDYIEAQGSMLYDPLEKKWVESFVKAAGLEVENLPPIVSPTDIIGKVTGDAAEATGLAEGTPVICGTTDTVMEVFASGAIHEGDITVKLATAGRICVITKEPVPNMHMVNYPHFVDGLWYPGTATKSCAASYRWYRDVFGGEYKELDREAAEIPIGCEGLIFHPHLNGELTPYADPSLCGSFTGVRATHTKGHFNRAVLEGVCYSLLDCKLFLDGLNVPHNKVATLIGGGSKGGLWSRITADTLGISLRITESSDSSLGSAMLAGIAVGVFEDADAAVKACIKEVSVIEPNPENTKQYRKVFEEYKAIHDALAPIYQKR